jgi:hypothetical protein
LRKQLWTVLALSFKMLIWQYAMMKEVFDPSVTYCINFCAQHQISKKAVIFLFAKPGCTDSFHFCNSFVIVLAPFAKSMLKVSYADRVYHVLVFLCMW